MQYYNVGSYYACQISQTGEEDPTQTILGEHSFSDLILWERVDEGTYRGTLEGAFPEGKTQFIYSSFTVQSGGDLISSPPMEAIYTNIFVQRIDDDTILIKQLNVADFTVIDGLNLFDLEIKVHV